MQLSPQVKSSQTVTSSSPDPQATRSDDAIMMVSNRFIGLTLSPVCEFPTHYPNEAHRQQSRHDNRNKRLTRRCVRGWCRQFGMLAEQSNRRFPGNGCWHRWAGMTGQITHTLTLPPSRPVVKSLLRSDGSGEKGPTNDPPPPNRNQLLGKNSGESPNFSPQKRAMTRACS